MGGPLIFQQGGVPLGGTESQVLAKMSDDDYDVGWVDLTASGEVASKWITLNMTSNASPAPYIASASSILDDNLQPFRAFDGDMNSTVYYWHSQNTSPVWLQIYTGQDGLAIDGFKIYSRPGYTTMQSPVSFDLEGSDDGSNYTKIKSYAGASYPNNVCEFSIANPVTYRYYRFNNMKSNYSASNYYVSIGEIEFHRVSAVSAAIASSIDDI